MHGIDESIRDHHNAAETASTAPAAETSQWRLWERIVWVGLCAVNLVPIWWTDRFPSQNGPWFLLATHMFKEYNNPNWDYSKYYVRNWLPFPHLLHDTLVGLVAHVAPLLTAERIVLSLYVILLPLSVFYFLSSLAPGRRWPGYLAFLVVLHYTFMRGYHDYTLSIPLFFITVAYWYPRRDRLTVGDAVILCGLGVLTYLSHLLTFAFLAGSIGWLRLFETGRWGKAFRDALIVSSAGWVLFVVFILLSPKSNWVDKSDTSWKTPYENAKSVCGEFFFSVSEYGAALATAASVWGVLWVFAQRRRAQGTEIPGILKTLRSPLGSLLIFFIVAYFATPYKVIGWHKANMRLLPISFILMLGVLAQMLPKDLSFRRALGLLFPVVIAACGSCALLTREIVRMHSMVDTYLSGIEHVGEKPVLLSVLIDNPAFGGIRPITRARDYYHIVKGGVNGDGIAAFNTIALMSYRHYPVSDSFPPYDREATDAVAVEKLRLYDHVLVWGESERLRSQLKDAAFALVHEKGPLQVYRIQ